ncbi:NAD(P)H-hydrate dehydratase [Halosquirtibacter laminarini]|uniref:NAD(P)H-hydrate dehydratase n=1 Tax=Halosquirtibacter laminarini TaxID=3374600 RepID=A0AC61NDK6_9BACT|nr:NAD(P)H-hydrate dehydratase [Prolixibacteraceae bacterium]
MKLWSPTQILEWDLITCRTEGITSIELMYRAASKWVQSFTKYYPKRFSVLVVVGPGNNGGDGLVIASLLYELGYTVKIYAVHPSVTKSDDALFYYHELVEKSKIEICYFPQSPQDVFMTLSSPSVVVDALFGIGLSRNIRGAYQEVVEWMNRIVEPIVSVDVPSGLSLRNFKKQSGSIVQATHTFTFEVPKVDFFFPENAPLIGELCTIPIGLTENGLDGETPICEYITISWITSHLIAPKRYSHKGTYGHAMIIAGSEGMMGASILACKGALSGGCGLITTHIPNSYETLIHQSVPELLVSSDESNQCFSSLPKMDGIKAIGIGPGLGQSAITQEALYLLMRKYHYPMVLDADALNILSDNPDWLIEIPGNSILTPHLKEFDRLFGTSFDTWERIEKAKRIAIFYRINILIKGKNSIIVDRYGSWSINSSGNSVLSKGGSGDVLTGLITSLIARGYRAEVALRLGVWIHGKAGDVFAAQGDNVSLNISTLPTYIGRVWELLQNSSSK